MKDDNLTLEVLIHFMDSKGNRIKPMSNRIEIPLKVSDVTTEECICTSLNLQNAIIRCLWRSPILQQLVLVSERSGKSGVAYSSTVGRDPVPLLGPSLGDIEIQEVQRIFQ